MCSALTMHFPLNFMAMDGDVNLMRAAIVASGCLRFSPTYANEIQTEYYGYRLDSVLLRMRTATQAARHPEQHQHGCVQSGDRQQIFKNFGPNNPQDGWSTRPSF